MKKYKQIEEDIISRISSGELAGGDKLDDIGALCQKYQVSHITVQKALENLSSQGYLKRIKGKGTFINEVPSSEKTRKIVFIVSDIESRDYSLLQLVSGAQQIANENGCSLLLEFVNGTEEAEIEAFERYANRAIDGFLLYVFSHTRLDKMIQKKGNIPYVMIDHCNRMLPCNFVSPNNTDGGFMATEYLIKKGHRKILFVTDRKTFSRYNTTQDRYVGYKNALTYYGLIDNKKRLVLEEWQDVHELLRAIRKEAITGIFLPNDRGALMIESQLIQKGVSIPNDVSLIGFDDYESSQYAMVPLTTIKQDFKLLGKTAMQLLLDCMKDQNGNQYQKILLPLKLIERASVKEIHEEE